MGVYQLKFIRITVVSGRVSDCDRISTHNSVQALSSRCKARAIFLVINKLIWDLCLSFIVHRWVFTSSNSSEFLIEWKREHMADGMM